MFLFNHIFVAATSDVAATTASSWILAATASSWILAITTFR
jgi:hypothetical protein